MEIRLSLRQHLRNLENNKLKRLYFVDNIETKYNFSVSVVLS